jgi:hypothetical protein
VPIIERFVRMLSFTIVLENVTTRIFAEHPMGLFADRTRHSGQNDPRRLWQGLKTLPYTWILREPPSRDIRGWAQIQRVLVARG